LEKCFPTAGFIYTIDTGINQVNFINKSRYSENYLWDFGDGSTSTVENPMHNYLSDGSYLITLTTSNCDSSVIHESIFQQNINFCSFTPTIFPDSLILCPNSKDTLWTQTYNSYQWYDSNGNIIPGATNQYLVVSADSIASEGKKFSVLTTKNNCSEMSRQAVRYMINWIRSDVYEVFDSMLPGNPCLGDTVKLILAYPIEHYTQWFNNGIPIPFANNDTLIVIASGNYQVSFYPYTCPDLISDSTPIILTFIDCNNGILENTKLPKVLVYPNPADGFINVKINSELVGTDYTIINILGNIMRTGKFEKEINNFKINDLNNGIYILKIGKINKQIIKLIKP
ncbi:MAG: PKD domain-containing protein, partial [Bacteroidetes bacterium]|nr:PKD domain-containing protein [Bacteroidota bacterium]